MQPEGLFEVPQLPNRGQERAARIPLTKSRTRSTTGACSPRSNLWYKITMNIIIIITNLGRLFKAEKTAGNYY